MRIVAITGTIGCGKSVVSQVLRVMGYPVYDCDSEAKRLMTTDNALITRVKSLLGDDAYLPDGSLNRAFVASCIFGDNERVAAINALVHPAVLRDIKRWAAATGSPLCFVETALLRESNMISILDDVWTVTAPIELCINRVARRSNLSPEQTRARIASQSNDLIATHKVIVNDNITPIIPQLTALLAQ